jgi:pimeloyl-ACP methyl ester carboxylesterase
MTAFYFLMLGTIYIHHVICSEIHYMHIYIGICCNDVGDTGLPCTNGRPSRDSSVASFEDGWHQDQIPGNFPINIQKIGRSIVLDASMLLKADARGRWVVLFNGNAGSRSLEKMSEVRSWISETMKVNVLHFDYRGVALSTGIAMSWNDLVEDGVAAVDALNALNAMERPTKISLFGFSLGGAICMKVAQLRPDIVDNVICDRSFIRAGDIVQKCAWLLSLTRWNVDVRSSYEWLEKRGRVLAVFAMGDPVSERDGTPYIPTAKELTIDLNDADFSLMNHQPAWKHSLQIFRFSNCNILI